MALPLRLQLPIYERSSAGLKVCNMEIWKGKALDVDLYEEEPRPRPHDRQPLPPPPDMPDFATSSPASSRTATSQLHFKTPPNPLRIFSSPWRSPVRSRVRSPTESLPSPNDRGESSKANAESLRDYAESSQGRIEPSIKPNEPLETTVESSNTSTEIRTPDIEDPSAADRPINADVRPRDPPDVEESFFANPEPVPGSKFKKQVYPQAPVKSGSWSELEYQERFQFVRRELKSEVDRHPELRDLAIGYELRMVGTNPGNAIPSIVIKCFCEPRDIKSLQSLFKSRAQKQLHCSKSPSASWILSPSASRSWSPSSSRTLNIPPFALVYFRLMISPIRRMGSGKPLIAFFDNNATYCGGLIQYQNVSATLGVSIQIDSIVAYLTVDHIFSPHEDPLSMSTSLIREADLEISGASSGTSSNKLQNWAKPQEFQKHDDNSRVSTEHWKDEEDDMRDTSELWEDDDDEYNYDDPPESEMENPIPSNIPSASMLAESTHVETWEKLIPPVKLDPSCPYLDWSLVRPKPEHLRTCPPNVFLLDGLHSEPTVLRQIRDTPRGHLIPVKMVSAIRGVLLGRILYGSSFLGSPLGSPPGREDCEVLTVFLDDPEGK